MEDKKKEPPRIIAEVDEETKKVFAEKLAEKGYSQKGWILRKIKEFIRSK